MSLSWKTVWNDGASADTSHLYVPLLDCSKDLSTTSFEFDLSIWKRKETQFYIDNSIKKTRRGTPECASQSTANTGGVDLPTRHAVIANDEPISSRGRREGFFETFAPENECNVFSYAGIKTFSYGRLRVWYRSTRVHCKMFIIFSLVLLRTFPITRVFEIIFLLKLLFLIKKYGARFMSNSTFQPANRVLFFFFFYVLLSETYIFIILYKARTFLIFTSIN